MLHKYITRYTLFDKIEFEEQANSKGVVDDRIKPVVDELNAIPEFMSMNSCQGGGSEVGHCPLTYVDFYVVNHHYDIAHALIGYIQPGFPEFITMES